MPQRRAFSVSAYLANEGAVMLVNHKKQQAWVPIGGELETGETPLEALIREVREEVGWELHRDYYLPTRDLLSPDGFIVYEEHEAGPKGVHMNFAFLLRGYGRDIRPCDEFTEHAWVTSATEKFPVPQNVHTILERILFRDG